MSTVYKRLFHGALALAAITTAATAVILVIALVPAASATPPTVYTVNTTDDHDDGTCDGDCTFHEAIDAANATNPAEIQFDLPACPTSCTIDISTNLPSIFGDNIAIDGTSQDGYVDDPIVVLNWIGPSIGDGPTFIGVDSSITSMKIINFRFALTLNSADLTANGNHIVDAEVDGIQTSGANITVTDNIIEGSGRFGINVNSGDGSLITGNVVTNSAGSGLSIQGDGVTIADNTVSGSTDSGIRAVFGNTGVTIEGNVVTDTGKVGIDSSARSSWVKDNTVSGSGWAGIRVGSTDNVVTGNTVTLNGHSGTEAKRQVGIALSGQRIVVTDNHVFDNTGDGIYVETTSAQIGGTDPGESNEIIGNGGSGIFIAAAEGSGSAAPAGLDPDPTNNTISGNIIFGNAGLGIDLAPEGVTANDENDNDAGVNRRQNFPVLVTAIAGSLSVEATFNSIPNTNFQIEFFANDTCDDSGHGEGQEFLANPVIITNDAGDASFDFEILAEITPGRYLTATATNMMTGDTSEFSRCLEITEPSTPTPIPSQTLTPGETPAPTPTPTGVPAATPTPLPTGEPILAQGDNNCDGDIQATDALAGLQQVAGLPVSQQPGCPTLGGALPATAPASDPDLFGDVDCDDDVDAVDALKILKFVAALPFTQNEPCTDIGKPL